MLNHDVEDVLDAVSCAMISAVAKRTNDLKLIEQAKLCAESFCRKYRGDVDVLYADISLTAITALKLRAEFLDSIKTNYVRSLPWYQRILEHKQIRADIKSFEKFRDLVRKLEV